MAQGRYRYHYRYLEHGVRYCRQRPVVGQIGYPEYVNTPFVDFGQSLRNDKHTNTRAYGVVHALW
jgi:hypothetical protein